MSHVSGRWLYVHVHVRTIIPSSWKRWLHFAKRRTRSGKRKHSYQRKSKVYQYEPISDFFVFFTDYFKSFRFPTISIFFLSYPFFTPLKDVATLYTSHLYSVIIFSTTNQSLRISGDRFSSLIFFDDNTMSSFLSFVYLYSVVILGTINLRIFFLDFRLSLSFSCFFFIFPSISLRYVFYACIHW